jgi:transcriptional regulator with XRE-family HTH domain
MGRAAIVPLPKVRGQLKDLGNNIRLARLRRKLSAVLVSQRAGIARETLSSIEQGSPSVSIGNYATVLFVLGLDTDLGNVARDDELGRKLQDAKLLRPEKT